MALSKYIPSSTSKTYSRAHPKNICRIYCAKHLLSQAQIQKLIPKQIQNTCKTYCAKYWPSQAQTQKQVPKQIQKHMQDLLCQILGFSSSNSKHIPKQCQAFLLGYLSDFSVSLSCKFGNLNPSSNSSVGSFVRNFKPLSVSQMNVLRPRLGHPHFSRPIGNVAVCIGSCIAFVQHPSPEFNKSPHHHHPAVPTQQMLKMTAQFKWHSRNLMFWVSTIYGKLLKGSNSGLKSQNDCKFWLVESLPNSKYL